MIIQLLFKAPERNPENIKIQGHLPHQMDISWEVREGAYQSMELNSVVPEVEIPFIFCIGILIISHNGITVKGRLTTSFEIVKQRPKKSF